MEREKKQELGQFYTTRNQYIFSGIEIPKRVTRFVEPFCGQGDLVDFLEKQMKKKKRTVSFFELFDIDPRVGLLFKKRQKDVVTQDTLLNPPSYSGKYVITNPPYRARNKSTNKVVFDKYNENDLFKCFLKSLLIDENIPDGGQIIIPLNFFSSIRKGDCQLRNEFLKHFKITRLNIFEEQVFDDTSYTVCAFQFLKKNPKTEIQNVNTMIFPKQKNITLVFDPKYNNIIGGEIYFLETSPNIKISRLVENSDKELNTQILLTALDGGTEKGDRIGLSISEKPYIGKETSRMFASLIISPEIDKETQEFVVAEFNKLIEKTRERYHSLFLPNYRESKEYARKRIPFDLVYKIVNNILKKRLN